MIRTHPAAEPRAASRGGIPAIVWILVLGAAVRLAFWSYFKSEPLHIWDERDYDVLARNLISHAEFTFTPGGTPTSLRPPLYPAIIAAVYSVFGVGNFGAVRFLQVVLSLLTVAVGYRLALSVTTRSIAILSAALLCFYPSFVVYNNLLLTETLFTLLLTATCWLAVLAMQRKSLRLAGLAGIALGLAALTRSAVSLAPPFLAIYFLLAWNGRFSQRLAGAAMLVLAFAVTIAPWSIRNSRLQNTFVTIDVMGGRNFMMGNYAHTPLYRSWEAIAIQGDKSWMHEVETSTLSGSLGTQGKVDKAALQQGIAFVKANPLLTAQRSIVKFFDFWGLEREIIAGAGQGYFGSMSRTSLVLATLLLAGSYAAAVLMAIFGAILTPLDDRKAHWLFLCVIVFLCGVHTIVFGHSRYHLPLMPLVLIYTASAFRNLPAIWNQRKSAGFVLATVLCLALAAGWTWNLVVVDWPRVVDAWSAIG